MKLIKLTQGKFAKVDDKDYDWLNQFKWCVSFERGRFYAVRRCGYKTPLIRMHRFILNVTISKKMVDHKDRDGLNNQRKNLRIATKSQNGMNRSKSKCRTYSSKFIGVYLRKDTNKWMAVINKKSKRIILGNFKNEKDAVMARNIGAKKYYREFAFINNIILQYPNEQMEINFDN